MVAVVKDRAIEGYDAGEPRDYLVVVLLRSS